MITRRVALCILLIVPAVCCLAGCRLFTIGDNGIRKQGNEYCSKKDTSIMATNHRMDANQAHMPDPDAREESE